MTKISMLTIALAATVSFNGYAEFDLSGVNSDSANSLLSSTSQLAQANSPVVDNLVKELSISPQQAATGAGALLSLAQNQLGAGQESELNSLIPGLSSLTSSGLLSSVENMESVKNAFGSVGLDPALISQFAPIILDYLGTLGASSGLMSSLGSIWQ
ncbi:DUF2780 domain-containing protein [Vibrio barjaei]|uniref:DUF2780 domain-containing protein n=1 Tax=Vibrio barjaei TaxID=1676683 RepID=UPI0007BB5AC9|nr:DUF2780 domain-containing protein [Vibrio barjaei]MCY9873141.1 DUF2780 domain-containing protein [Vibrio barjaei]OIN27235.1 hypothetical protein AWH66_2023315 [Vibrio barjaei]